MKKDNLIDVSENEKPPILGSWNNMYKFVLGFGLVLVLIFSFLTHKYK